MWFQPIPPTYHGHHHHQASPTIQMEESSYMSRIQAQVAVCEIPMSQSSPPNFEVRILCLSQRSPDDNKTSTFARDWDKGYCILPNYIEDIKSQNKKKEFCDLKYVT